MRERGWDHHGSKRIVKVSDARDARLHLVLEKPVERQRRGIGAAAAGEPGGDILERGLGIFLFGASVARVAQQRAGGGGDAVVR